jgi:hypothetical protein
MHLSAEDAERNQRQIFSGSRETIKTRSEYYALNLVREYLNQLSADGVGQTADGDK